MTKKRGFSFFNDFYSEIYKSRWTRLFDSLKNKKNYVAKFNSFADTNSIFKDFSEKFSRFEYYPNSFISGFFEKPEFDVKNLKQYYLMDPASIFPAINLEVTGNEKILDACAAPGGKSLVIADFLKDGVLYLNDISNIRLNRLKNVINEYLPSELLNKIQISKHDAAKWCMYESNVFDRILLDAPCSSEKHLIHDDKLMSEWSVSRTKQLSIRQYSLIVSAFRLLKPKGILVYSTCSISPYENDGVLEKLHKKYKGHFIIRKPYIEFGEKTKYGWQIFPDNYDYGPIYFSVIEKLE